jgi:hypothetical protein
MQKRFLSFFAAAMLAAILFSSCSSKTNKQGRYIPATAGVVFHLNGESLTSKLPWEEVKQNDLFKKMLADTSVPAFAKSVLENPENSGVNVKSDLILFIVKDTAGGYAAIEGTVKDEAKFKQFIAAAHKDGKETSKDGYTYYTDAKASIGYNKERFFLTYNTPELSAMNYPSMTDNSGPLSQTASRDMAAVTASLINLKESASLGENEKFSELIGTKGDAHLWYSAQYFSASGSLPGPMAMLNISKLTEGAVTTATISFENGKIVADTKSYGGKELTELYKKYSGGSFDKSMVKNIPSQNVAGLLAMNFKPEGLREFIKLLGVDGMANMGAAKLGFTMDDFIKANKGDILFAVTDIKDDSLAGKDAQVFFSASIGDKTSFNKLIDAGKTIGSSMGGGAAAEKIAYSVNDKYFVISNKKAAADTYLAGSANSSFGFLDQISGGPIGAYVNFQYIFNAIKKENTDSLDLASFTANSKTWDNMIISGGNFKDGGITQHIEINLVDKNTNSLKQLNSYVGTMAAIEEKKKAQRAAMWESESVFPAPMDTAPTVTPATP